MALKKEIRTRVLKLRNALTASERSEKSRIIYQKIVALPLYQETDEIYCYVNNLYEVQTTLLIEHALKSGKRVAVPKVSGDSMDFYYIQNRTQLAAGTFHILEPTTTIKALSERALVIMPVVAFDEGCNRIGYGKGYYDRYLQLHNNYRRIAIAYEVQRVPCIPADDFDMKPEILITEG